ncbi:MAG: sigma-54 dependent transcriptional regulator [Verrucomicrobiota bacterium]
MSFERIMIVDDDPLIRRMLVSHLQKQHLTTVAVVNCQQALEEQKREPADLVVIDLMLPDGNGLELLQSIKKITNDVEIVLMTGFGTIETAVEAMQLGAANYLLKPFTIPQFSVAIDQLEEKRKLETENTYLRERLATEDGSTGHLLFRSEEMERIYRLIKRVGPTNATVLIEGESGTGKELIAHAIHMESARKSKPYIKVNCAAVPENLLESEFFGHEKGAFTGATARREGRFELANTGTLLLDEVTEIDPSLQAKLLRVLQEQEFERVGGTRTLKSDVRIIATTNRDLSKAVDRGEFRQDLYFRLNVVPIKVPPLRSRKGEVDFLLECFLERFAKKHNKEMPNVSLLAMQQLGGYHWPGNVRELQNYAERAVILSEQGRELEFSDFVMTPSSPVDSVLDTRDTFPSVSQMEERLIGLALKRTKGNRNEAAKLLDINVRTLRNKLHEYADREEKAKAQRNASASGNESETTLDIG